MSSNYSNSPVKLIGARVTPIWSGNKLSRIYASFSDAGNIGESWETSVDSANCAFAVMPDGKGLIPFSEYLNSVNLPVPPLVKLLDSAQPLSIQVHPDEDAAAELGGVSKSEIWYVLAAEKDAYIYYGTKPDATENELAEAVRSDSVEDTLCKIYVKPGDVYMIPPGLIHSLGGGITVLEVQNKVGTTYRVKDIAGTRETHVAESLRSIKLYTPEECAALAFTSDVKYDLRGTLIASTADFTIYRCTADFRNTYRTISDGTYMFCENGAVRCGDTIFEAGDSVFFPRKDCEMQFDKSTSVIFVI